MRGLYVPYVQWSLIFLLLHNLFYTLHIYDDEYGFKGSVSHLYTWEEMGIRAIHIAVGLHGTEQLLGGYWFLPQLLYASIMGFFIIKYIKNLYAGCALALLGAIIASAFDLHVPFWGIKSLSFLSTAFFLMGYLYKQKFNNWNQGYLTLLFAVTVAAGSICCHVSMLTYTAEEIIPYFICAVCGTVMTLNISRYIALHKNRFTQVLVYIGNNTLTVLTWHFLCFKFISLLVILHYSLPMEQLACFPVLPEYTNLWPVYTLAGVGIPLTGKYLWHKVRLAS